MARSEKAPPREAPDRDYEVGYRRPPRDHQFKPKQSGNPKGRPKRTRNLADTVSRHLDGEMTVRQGGRERRMNRREILVQKLYERALGGDNRAASLLLNYDLANRGPSDGGGSDGGPLTEQQHQDILDAYFASRKGGDE